MKHVFTAARRKPFDVLLASRSSQAAKMTFAPGGASDEDVGNEHPDSEQWLLVLSGSGEAVVGRRRSTLRRIRLRRGSLLLIERGELHQIKNTGRKELSAVTLYVPPAYRSDGELRRR